MFSRQFRSPFVSLLTLILLFTATVIVLPQKRETLSAHVLNAQSAIEKKDFKTAKKEIELELSARPDNPDAHFLMGLVYRSQKKFDEAAKSFANATRLRPNFVEAHYIHARSVLDSGHAVTSKVEKEFDGRHKTTFNIDELMSARQEIEWSIEHGIKSSDSYSLAAGVELVYATYRFHDEAAGATFQESSSDISKKAVKNFDEALRLAKPGQTGIVEIKSKADFLRGYLSGKALEHSSYIRPKPLNSPHAEYTDEAKRNQITGIVLIGVHLDETGNIIDKTMISGLGYGLDESAIKAINRLKTAPATLDGKPIPVTSFLLVEFELF